MDNLYIPTSNYKVFVRCDTYNQSNYIEDTLFGFALQKTSFPFVCMVMDDHSTDGTQDVMKLWATKYCAINNAVYKEDQYSKIIIAKHKTNTNCMFAFYFLKQNLYKRQNIKNKIYDVWRKKCEYEALCEGDDYWTEEHKLQEQVRILNEDKTVMLVHTGFMTVDSNGKEYYRKSYCNFQKISKKEKGLLSLFDRNHIMTLSIMFRVELLESELFKACPFLYDYTYFFSAAFLGQIRFIPTIMGAYRMNPDSLMNSKKDKVNADIFEIYKYFTIEFYKRTFSRLSLSDNIYIRCKILANIMARGDRQFCNQIIHIDSMTRVLFPIMTAYEYIKHKMTV